MRHEWCDNGLWTMDARSCGGMGLLKRAKDAKNAKKNEYQPWYLKKQWWLRAGEGRGGESVLAAAWEEEGAIAATLCTVMVASEKIIAIPWG